MKLATRDNGERDGCLVVVSRDLTLMADAADIAPTLQQALELAPRVWPALQARYQALNARRYPAAQPYDPWRLLAPLPRAWQWLDGSAFLSHGERMQRAFHLPPIAGADQTPLMYQGSGDDFLPPHAGISCRRVEDGLDFEGEFAVVVDEVPQGCSPQQALSYIRLIVLLNDISLRALAPREMQTGFGFIHAKPASAFAPVALTPDELGEAWQHGRVALTLQVMRNGEPFGCQSGSNMHFHFGELIAHAAQTRRLRAGTVVGSGTVSGPDASRGASCIAEVRAMEMLAHGEPRTPFLSPGERVTMAAHAPDGRPLFGVLDQHVVMLME
ncbi:TPA: fumarylacetoacetate hydrolase family protein [Klebsiella variicola subsp. variicola]|uniref:Fumarylacetoacetate hydrolase family protein n=1 Tax=Klebsiella variicola TaxID=244366 RepID=A0AAW9PD07_KLEVA|nr:MULTISPECIES: fumarylacetoacetate hydrolase family protein [Klebsiella]UYK37307.1 fumarylacetoacetate hydrolase family protein [Klebsiella pneumoniae]AXO73521.1 fumarylacetoacetate hydrolase [Klebsiella variicola]EIY5056093.1 fumarylacetoacetate hydrolase family protein [Klebsiella variicola]EIY5090366.1 fumarylacetoacetate hydrolase family protein [Klebsiella variicola]EIY5382520.1 fumarylacetoacetate hydrolase family protein [Klebsiella variicola]